MRTTLSQAGHVARTVALALVACTHVPVAPPVDGAPRAQVEPQAKEPPTNEPRTPEPQDKTADVAASRAASSKAYEECLRRDREAQGKPCSCPCTCLKDGTKGDCAPCAVCVEIAPPAPNPR